MWTWVITAIAILFTTKVKSSSLACSVPKNAKSIFAPMCHICTPVPCFQNAAEAAQFSGSCHFQVCLPAPLSSCCLFLPATFHMALVVRIYLLLLTVHVCSLLSLRFFSDYFENSLPFSIIVSEKHQKVSQKLLYFPWDFNKIITPSSRCARGSHWIREIKRRGWIPKIAS